MTADSRSILIIDDDEDVLVALEWLLESEGYRTTTAWSREQAIALLSRTRFDLILVDEHLASADGRPLFDELEQTQPGISFFLLYPRSEGPPMRSSAVSGVCKWEHGEIRTKIRSLLPV